jgi:TolA-binding protein
MKNIPIIIFIVLFSFILLHFVYVKVMSNRLIEGLESGADAVDTADMNERFKKLEDKVNKMQEQIVQAEKTNEENAQNLKKLKSKS